LGLVCGLELEFKKSFKITKKQICYKGKKSYQENIW